MMSVFHGSDSIGLEALSPSTSISPEIDVVHQDGPSLDTTSQGESTGLAPRAETEHVGVKGKNKLDDNPGKDAHFSHNGHSLIRPLHDC